MRRSWSAFWRDEYEHHINEFHEAAAHAIRAAILGESS